MVRTASLFSQLLNEIPRSRFARLVAKHGTARHGKGFTSWTRLTAMLFCQAAQLDSLRETCLGLACYPGKLVRLGVPRSPNTSSLSYAKAHRSAALFEESLRRMANRFRSSQGLTNATGNGIGVFL